MKSKKICLNCIYDENIPNISFSENGVCNYCDQIEFLKNEFGTGRKKGQKLLKKFAKILGKDNYLVIGVDIRKNKKLMEKAYNDSKGLTAEFNKNILKGINKRTGAKFKTEYFEHFAYFNDKRKRIEMHLISRQNQNILLKDYDLKILKGESIHTENSHKYSALEFEKLALSSGYKKIDFLTDQKKYFGIFFLKVLDN